MEERLFLIMGAGVTVWQAPTGSHSHCELSVGTPM